MRSSVPRVKRILVTARGLFPYLPDRARSFIWTNIVLSSSLALLDIFALSLLAASLAGMVSGTTITLPVVGLIGPEGYLWIVLIVCALIVVKSTLALLLQWWSTRKMSTFELEIGDWLFAAYIRAPWTERLKRNTAQLVRLADVGIANITGGFLLPLMQLPQLIVTAAAVVAVIVVVQPITAAVTVTYLGLIGLLLYRVLASRTVEAGNVNRDYSLRVAGLMTDMVSALKEITLRDKAGEVAAIVHDNRVRTARARAHISFLSSIPRFVLDAALVGGIVLVGAASLLLGGVESAVSAIALFGVAAIRLVPSITGFQALMTVLNANLPLVEDVIDDITAARRYIRDAELVGKEPITGSARELILDDVSLTYPGADHPSLRELSATVPIGQTLAIVGPSGAGKSSLIDILLGLMQPTSGSIRLGEQELTDVLAAWRARVGYVPQDVAIFDGTIAQNVALSWGDDVDEERVREALERAHLWSLISNRGDGIHERVGERGLKISGGQRQRLGIARALYSDPLILVLDEATSALDTKTESDVAQSLRELRGDVTIISVAHRLSTIRDYDEVWYMSEGRIEARGTFDEVIAQESEFAHQARLAGLL